MKRRDFNKALALLGSALTVPPLLTKKGLISPLQAKDISKKQIREARAMVIGDVEYVQPSSLPTVINIFMYGGPSELAGNLTNISDISANSQNPYPAAMLRDVTNNNGQITANGLWASAGGNRMEAMIAANQMTLYRTVNRVVDDSKAHRTSIMSAQVGGLDEEAPGMGTTLAAILLAHNEEFQDPANIPLLPFVSFEGETVMFNAGDISLALPYRPVSLDRDFRNPYTRSNGVFTTNATATCGVSGTDDCHQILDTLASNVSLAAAEKYQKILDAFAKRKELDDFIGGTLGGNPVARVDQNIDDFSDTSFGRNVRAATVLALANPDTKFITLSTGGLGGWDNHDNAIGGYTTRVENLMRDLQAAMTLLSVGTLNEVGNPLQNPRNDVIINCYGEFGRNVNLNGSMGWDHGNNMNLYTFGGADIGGRQLGKIVGSTRRIGTSGQNRQFTSPTDGSYEFEPMSIASSVYKYFGVQNPEALTATEDSRAPDGFPAIDETIASEPLV